MIETTLQELLDKFASSSRDEALSDKELVQAVRFLNSLTGEQMTQTHILPSLIDLTTKLLSWSLRRTSSHKKHIFKLEKEAVNMKRVLQLHQATFQTTMHNALQCPICPKRFLDQGFLEGHVKKRHPETGLDSNENTPLMNRIRELTTGLNLDRDVGRLSEQLALLTLKVEEAERLLTQERESRKNLEENLLTRVEVMEDNLSCRHHMPVDHVGRSSSPIRDSASPQVEQMMMKQLEQVQKISRDMSQLKEKLETRPEDKSPQPSKQTQRMTPEQVESMLLLHLARFGVDEFETGINQERFNTAMDIIHEDRERKQITPPNLPKTLNATQQRHEKRDEQQQHIEVNVVEKKPELSVRPKEKHEKGKREAKKRLTGILKTNSSDKNDKQRRISFSENRIEISPEESLESEDMDDDDLKWSGDEIAVEEEDRQSPVPPPEPKPRISVLKPSTN